MTDTALSSPVYHRPMAMELDVADSGSHRGEADALAPAAALFRSLGDPNRLAILHHLMGGEHRVIELTDHLGLAQSTVSAHLACLRDCGLVVSRPEGRASLWAITAQPELRALLAAAESMLEVTADAVQACRARDADARTRLGR